MTPAKMTIRFVPGSNGGWTATCACCSSVVVRKHWALTMAHAIRHEKLHRSGGPFAVSGLTDVDMS